MNIVFISGFLSEQSVGGPALRSKNSLEILKKLGDVSAFDLDSISTFIWTGGSQRAEESARENQPKVQSRIGAALERIISRALQVLEIFTQLVSLSAYFQIKRLILDSSPDVVWFSFASKFPKLFLALRRKFPSIFFVADTDAVISSHLQRASESLVGIRSAVYLHLARQTRKYESKILLEASVTTAVSEFDRQEYMALCPSAELFVFPNVVEAHGIDGPESKKSDSPRLLLTGTFGGPESAMTHGTLWFLKEVFPKVLGSVPDLSVDIVGRNANQIQQYVDLPRAVRVIADVPSVTPYLSEAWCNVCPLFFESGTRFKILEASERAVPTVSTALGAEGLDFVHGQDILIAEDSIDFAENIVKLLKHQDLRELIGQRSRGTLVQRYSIGAGYSAAKTVLEQLSS